MWQVAFKKLNPVAAGGLIGDLLTPVATIAFVLAAWRLGSDLRWAAEFPFEGLLSHWIVWVAIGAAVQFAGTALARGVRTPQAY